MYKRALLCTLFAALSACAAQGPVFSGLKPVDTGVSSVVIYRPHTWINSAGYPHVYIDGEKRGALLDTGYQTYDLAPGNHKFALANFGFWDGKQEWEFTTKPSERAYFRVLSGGYQFNVVGTSYETSKTIRIDGVPEEQATRELQGLHLSQ